MMLRCPWTLGENWATFYSNIWSQLSVTWFKAAHHTRLVTLLDRSKLSQEDWNIRKLLHSVRLWEATVRNSRLVSTYLYSQYLGNAKILGSSFTPEVNVVRNLDSPLTEAAIIKQLTVLKYTFAFHILCRFRHQNKLFQFLNIGEI